MIVTRKGRESFEPIRFNKGLPQGDALYPRLYCVLTTNSLEDGCYQGIQMSKPISFKVTDLLYIYDLTLTLHLRVNLIGS